MRKIVGCLLLLSSMLVQKAGAQDTLPRISVRNLSNKIVISWKNNYGAKIANINIQRSKDSIRNFTTIGTVLNPLSKENGYVDTKASNVNLFYRVFVAFEGGSYVFTKSYRPTIDTARAVVNNTTTSVIDELDSVEVPGSSINIIIPEPPTQPEDETELIPASKLPKIIQVKGFLASKYVHTSKDNNLQLNLPDATTQKYSLKVYDENEELLFEVKQIKESYLLIERVNFMKAGWYYYDLLDDGFVIEKHKFYISKDGRIGAPPPDFKRPNKPA